MISILGTGCKTATAENVAQFIEALHTGLDRLAVVPSKPWSVPAKAGFEPRAFRFASRSRVGNERSVRALLTTQTVATFHEALASARLDLSALSLNGARLGVIFASTKGFAEDLVWNEDEAKLPSKMDPLTPLMVDVIAACGLKPSVSVCVSNACASSLAALSLAKVWLNIGRAEHVIVFAADAIDSFVLHGFHHLRVLSGDRTRPFAKDRSGFHLGDAAACVILSSTIGSDIELIDAQIDSEGHAATRPSDSGESLLRACRKLNTGVEKVDLVIAHGTSTRANDATEDRVFSTLFEKSKAPWITGTKWSVGHTLGASGLLDVIAASEVLRTQELFKLHTTSKIDPEFQARYLINQDGLKDGPNEAPKEAQEEDRPAEASVASVLVTSLGFGGVHAAALVGRVSKNLEAKITDRPQKSASPNKFFSTTFEIKVPYPALETPSWASKSDRWYQLDQPAYSLAQAYSVLQPKLGRAPDYLILASPGASNQTDRDFAKTGAVSPSKFVHTLANIRASSLLQVMEWAGPMLCLQNDPRTREAALMQATLLLESDAEIDVLWIVGFDPEQAISRFDVITRAPMAANTIEITTLGLQERSKSL